MSVLKTMGTIIIAAALTGCSPSLKQAEKFKEQPIKLATYNLHDIRVVDVNADQRLDIFTTNHSARQSLAVNQGSLRFADSLSQWGLDQDSRFPGLALALEEPDIEYPGLYINWKGKELVVRLQQSSGGGQLSAVSGTIELYTPVTLNSSKGFTVKIDAQTLPLGATRTLIHFSGRPGGYFSFTPGQDAVPLNFHLEQVHNPKNIYVGPQKISPSTTDFSIRMRDRHAMAWADYDSDMRMDVFIARGALSGMLKNTPLTMWDALYVQRSGGMTDIGESVLPDKRGCPGREAQWADFDHDGKIDIFVVCGRDEFHSQLLRQSHDGTFVDVADEAGLTLTSEGKFIWFDIDSDGYPDMLWVDSQGIYLYKNQHGHFQSNQLARFTSTYNATGLHMADIDRDGEMDVFVESPSDSRILLSENGTFKVIGAADFGLPSANLASGWVDIDNDGVQEFYSVPHGVYRRNTGGTYSATGMMQWKCGVSCPYTLNDARVTWADMDNDGTRDLILATRLQIKSSGLAQWVSRWLGNPAPGENAREGRWMVRVFTNTRHLNHWLEVNLIGPPGNRQGLGARLSVQSGDTEEVQEVGHAEGSRYSQGHYRVYFGLGQLTHLSSLSVLWPDGTHQKILNPPVDNLITVNWNDHTNQ